MKYSKEHAERPNYSLGLPGFFFYNQESGFYHPNNPQKCLDSGRPWGEPYEARISGPQILDIWPQFIKKKSMRL